MKKGITKTSTMPASWKKLLCHIPNYDPIATAERCYFDPEKAKHVLDFFEECLVFVEGDKGGKPFHLETWQKAIVANLYGWMRPDDTRRYRETLVYIARKNGKTPLIAGLVLYGLFCEEEPGNQIYSAAGDKDQASLIYRHAKAMMLAEPELARRGEFYETSKTIIKKDSLCKYQALSSDVATKHGLNASMILVDELHAQPNSHLVDTLITSVASRRQPLIVFITTADFDRPSPCNDKLDYAKKVQQGIIKDVSFLPVIYEVPRDADWRDHKIWPMANPNLGVSVSKLYMETACKRAIEVPTYQNAFKRLHLNMQTSQDVLWIDLDKWDACHDTELTLDELEGERCFAGLDLASTRDLCALALWFPDAAAFFIRYWLPHDTAFLRQERARIPYVTWAQEGFISLTPGNVADYDFIREECLQIVQPFQLSELAIDRWNSTQLQTQFITEGIKVFQFAQTSRVMGAPTTELERLVLNNSLRHFGDPVTRWCASNVVLDTDHEGNAKPSKERSNEKIDGIVALVMAIGRGMVAPKSSLSVYETRGLLKI